MNAAFGAGQPYCTYLLPNRMKMLMHDGFGIWLAASRLNQGKFNGPGISYGSSGA